MDRVLGILLSVHPKVHSIGRGAAREIDRKTAIGPLTISLHDGMWLRELTQLSEAFSTRRLQLGEGNRVAHVKPSVTEHDHIVLDAVQAHRIALSQRGAAPVDAQHRENEQDNDHPVSGWDHDTPFPCSRCLITCQPKTGRTSILRQRQGWRIRR